MFQEDSIETCILSRMKQITSPGWMHETSSRTWCTGKTQGERVERELGGGIGMGNTCKPMPVLFQCMTKFTTNKKKKRMGIPVVTREYTPGACCNSRKPMRLPPRHEMRPDSPALQGRFFFFFNLFIYLFVVNFVIHWNETAMGLHVFPIPIPTPTSLSTRYPQVFAMHQVRELVSCIQPGLVISFILDTIHVSMLFS